MKAKTLLAIIISIIAGILAGRSQTLNLQAPVNPTSKNKISCSGNVLYSDGVANFIPQAMQNTNKWYYQTTNYHTMTFTNNSSLIQCGNDFGFNLCGHSSVVWTDSTPSAIYRFTVYWPTNTPLPGTNNPITLVVTGFRTNAP